MLRPPLFPHTNRNDPYHDVQVPLLPEGADHEQVMDYAALAGVLEANKRDGSLEAEAKRAVRSYLEEWCEGEGVPEP